MVTLLSLQSASARPRLSQSDQAGPSKINPGEALSVDVTVAATWYATK